jgi:hypothetical protein
MPPFFLTGEGLLECFRRKQAERVWGVMKRKRKAFGQRGLLNGAFKSGKTIYCRLIQGTLNISERDILSQGIQVFGRKSSDLSAGRGRQ